MSFRRLTWIRRDTITTENRDVRHENRGGNSTPKVERALDAREIVTYFPRRLQCHVIHFSDIKAH